MKRHLVIALACLAVILTVAALQARQPVEISGSVTDNLRHPIAHALVSVPALNESASTDGRGQYRILIKSKVRRGQKVVIQASHEGFDRISRPVDLAPKGRFRIDFRLPPLE